MTRNNIICGDCKDWLPYVPDNSVDLIYIDPPFFSNKTYEIVWGNGFELRSFGDRWKGGINHYIGWMRDKIIEAHRVLKPTGSIVLHCDHHANHHLRILLDELFGDKNFVNEIVWYYKRWTAASKSLQKMHDNIFCYSKSNKYKFNPVYKDPTEGQLRKHKKGWDRNSVVIKGKRQPQLIIYDEKKVSSAIKKGTLKEDDFARVVKPKLTKSLEDDVWQISFLNSQSKERIGYRTQKPEALLKKFITIFSNKGDIVLDFFGGGGTTAKVAYDLNRRFITGDISPVAVRVIKDRLNKAGCKNYIDCNPYLTEPEWRLIDGHVFAEKVCEYMGWVVNPKKSGDGGIDGWADDRKRIPIQIKNSKVNVSVVRDLAGVCNASYKQGIVVGWSFSTGCYEFVSALERKSKIKIELKEAGNIVQPIGYIEKVLWQKLYAERIKEAKKQPQFIDDRLGKKLKTA